MKSMAAQIDEITLEKLNDDNDRIEVPNKSAKESNLLYGIDDAPPWYLAVILGFQQFLTLLSGMLSLPFLLAPALCIEAHSPARAQLFSSMLFSSGIATVLQTVVGVRLPIVQGSTVTFLIPILNMLSLPEWKCPHTESGSFNVTENFANLTENRMESHEDKIWQHRMRTVQGSVMAASLLEVFLGLSGCVGAILHLITPLTIVPTITLIGLSLIDVTTQLASKNWPISIATMFVLLIFSQAMNSVRIPIPKISGGKISIVTRLPVFSLFPVLLTIILMWSLCAILTATNMLPTESRLRTDTNLHLVRNSNWILIPYPGQWGAPNVSVAVVFGLFAAVIASIIESIGDYYACARLSGAPSLPAHAVNRGIMMEGFGCIIGAAFGNGCGSTSYSDNIGAIGLTRVGSRRVIVLAGLLMMGLGVFTKFGALFLSIPSPIVGGIFFVIFGMIAATGLANLQFVNLNSSRNLIVFGFSLFSGLALPRWVVNNKDTINTGNQIDDQVLFMILSSSLFIGGVLGCLLDNFIPGSAVDRGVLAWRRQMGSQGTEEGHNSLSTYDIPYMTHFIEKWRRWTRFVPICPTFTQFAEQ